MIWILKFHIRMESAPELASRPASSSKHAARATQNGSAHCKGPQDHLPVIRYACFVPVKSKILKTGILRWAEYQDIIKIDTKSSAALAPETDDKPSAIKLVWIAEVRRRKRFKES